MRKYTPLFLLLLSLSLFGQNPVIDSLKQVLASSEKGYKQAATALELARNYERIDINEGKKYAHFAYRFKDSDSLLAEANNQLGRYNFFTGQMDSASSYFENAKQILLKLNQPKRVASVNISLGAIQLRKGEYLITIKTLTESATYFESIKDSLNVAKCYSNIASAFAELERYPKAIEYSEKALQIFRKKKLTQFEMITLPNLATQHYKNGDTLTSIRINAEAEILALELEDKRSLSMIYNNLGDIYLNKNPSKAEDYLRKTLSLKSELNLVQGTEIAQSNLGYIHLKRKEYQAAISLFEKAASKVKGKQLVSVYNNLKEAYYGIGNLDKALEFSEKGKILNDSLLNTEYQRNFLEIQTQYETEKKEKEIISLKSANQDVEYKRITNRNYLIAALITLITTLFLAFLFRKNSKRKQLIALQHEKIKSQVFERELRTQELNGIDNILDAQEKERSKIAADLHDNLGSKVATLKLYLENYKDQKSFENYHDKIKSLTNETYAEIRKVAQNKNFGAHISKGLIPSTQFIAKQISGANTIDIKVINIDVKRRIENTIEIQIFRIIQELLTNIIKHSKASEAVIQFSEQENTLTIITEDNGIGFNLDKEVAGIGIQTIENRIEKIQGDIAIDTSLGNGTTIILNIPI